jgi:hypothetical protein
MRARDWDEDYIYGLAVQEYDDIEFKASPTVDLSSPDGKNKTVDALAKEICALANSGGGFLVLGIKDPKACKTGLLEVVDGGVPMEFGKVDTAEWLRQNIPNMTEHKLRGFEVHPIETAGASSRIVPDKAVFVIGVPDSLEAPHQNARDHKYYVRVGGNSVPAPHRIVMDIVGRRQHPHIELDVLIEGRFQDYPGRTIDIPRQRKFVLKVTATNTGSVYAQYVNVLLRLPTNFVPNVDTWIAKQVEENGEKVCLEEITNTRRDIISGDGPYANYGPSWFAPILPGRSRQWEVPLDSDYSRIEWNEEAIRWIIFADNAPPVVGERQIKTIALDPEWSPNSCPCCGAEKITSQQWNCDCEVGLVRGGLFTCPNCGYCTGLHCRCGR